MWPVCVRTSIRASRPSRRRPADPAGPRARHGRRPGRGARDLRAHRAPGPRGARDGGDPRLLAGRTRRGLVAARWFENRSERLDRRRGSHAVPGGRSVGVGDPQIKAALRKLVRALPEPFRAEAEAAASAVVIDPASWDRTHVPTPAHLDELQRAVVEGVQVRIVYAAPDRPETERTVHPLGLVAKASVWYLIAATDAGMRTFRLSRVRAVTLTMDPVDRPEGFDLETHWRSVVAELDERVTFRAGPRRGRGDPVAEVVPGDPFVGPRGERRRPRRDRDPQLVGPALRPSSRGSADGWRSWTWSRFGGAARIGDELRERTAFEPRSHVIACSVAVGDAETRREPVTAEAGGRPGVNNHRSNRSLRS